MTQGDCTDLRTWYWEGNVQATVARTLSVHGWIVRKIVDTARREPGKDIEAERGHLTLWVTVKGYPADTSRTNPNTQARHWFSHALFDVILWRGEGANARIIVALPTMATYQRLAARTTWFEQAAGFSYLWVTEDGVETTVPLVTP